MKHALTAMRTGIDDEAIPSVGNSLQFRNFVAGQHQTPEKPDIRILKFGNRGHMFSGDNERMRRRLGIDIIECYYQIVLVDECRGNGPRNDFAKETFAHELGPFLKPDFPNRIASS